MSNRRTLQRKRASRMSASGDGGRALHDLVHRIQDALIAQNARRIRELEAERERLKGQAA